MGFGIQTITKGGIISVGIYLIDLAKDHFATDIYTGIIEAIVGAILVITGIYAVEHQATSEAVKKLSK